MFFCCDIEIEIFNIDLFQLKYNMQYFYYLCSKVCLIFLDKFTTKYVSKQMKGNTKTNYCVKTVLQFKL